MTDNNRRNGPTKIGDLLPKVIPFTAPAMNSVDTDIINPEDLIYTHSVFLQCFMPLRHNARNANRWQVNNGKASLVMRGGELVKPQTPNTFKECAVPAGPKARLVAAYINDQIYRKRSLEVNLGETMRKFMATSGIPIGGKNGHELQREVENFAATEIIIGIWNDDGTADQAQAKVASRMSFWIEKNPEQRTFWQPSMLVSTDYFNSVLNGGHIAPIYWPGYIALQHNPRAMDIFKYLTYRLRKPLQKPVYLKDTTLHGMFGKDCRRLAHFWPRFITALKEAHKQYPEARVEVMNDCIRLLNSPALIPYRKLGMIHGPC